MEKNIYPPTIASVGQTPTHAPQSIHFSASIQRLLFFSTMASTAHSASHAAQFVQESSITLYDIQYPFYCLVVKLYLTMSISTRGALILCCTRQFLNPTNGVFGCFSWFFLWCRFAFATLPEKVCGGYKSFRNVQNKQHNLSTDFLMICMTYYL